MTVRVVARTTLSCRTPPFFVDISARRISTKVNLRRVWGLAKIGMRATGDRDVKLSDRHSQNQQRVLTIQQAPADAELRLAPLFGFRRLRLLLDFFRVFTEHQGKQNHDRERS
ncbi:MAG: hypothetical protein ACI93T_003148 [Porticoccaceae bacterium]|jgi:hypothetical protein